MHGGLLTPALYLDGPPDSRKLLHHDINEYSFELLVKENFAPTFPKIINETDVDKKIDIEGSYVSIQLRKNDPWKGDIIYDDEYDVWAMKLLESLSGKKRKIVVLSDFEIRSDIINRRYLKK